MFGSEFKPYFALLLPGGKWPWPDPHAESRGTADEHDLKEEEETVSGYHSQRSV